MMKKLKILLSIIAMSIVMIGCGGGGTDEVGVTATADDGIATVDNSILADGDTNLGYYGEFVMFGNHTVAGAWILTDPNDPNNPIYLLFSTVPEGIRVEDSVIDTFAFGVSQDGRSVLISPDDIESDDIQLYLDSAITADCYDATMFNTVTNVAISNISICAEGSTSSSGVTL